ncbi:MBL fold metallo-hydrolase [Marinisporobacter balticus]|uniref:Glyoxylase-like metal-dependent hydrolase (Beta-lactamase superfamily II) n=1 Tax=Marinisporobacter balticus TaxID=2018667 RepID=A0A4R2KMB9_9FIRM|nr:MBL fold metallo-hydrolase [Marinisporobacter balticus]TCO74574.1 glyoxylase-like metal-dependent hydrolase (beta-lactamase superfamily II) [Marinisporobacter balticus]
MKLKRFIVGMIETNAYILYDENSLEAFIIDPGDEPKTFIQYIDKKYLKPIGIILTHYHYDHIGATLSLKKKYNMPIYIHKKDVAGLKNPSINHSISSCREAISITPDRSLIDGDTIEASWIVLEVIHTPGHTPGGICLKVRNEHIIFTGDTIFNIDLGRTDLEGGNENAMKNAIRNKISKWDDCMTIYPGHGDAASMEYVRKKNIEFLDIMGKR